MKYRRCYYKQAARDREDGLRKGRVMNVSELYRYCKDRLSYCPRTGVLKWVDGRLAGCRAGSCDCNGRRKIKILGKTYKEHRIIFLMMTGRFPIGQIDHVDHDPSNNEWCNIRECSERENRMNSPKRKGKKTSIYTGVSKHSRDGNYRVRISRPDGGVYTKYFKKEEDAAIHASEKYLEFGYHPNHGS